MSSEHVLARSPLLDEAVTPQPVEAFQTEIVAVGEDTSKLRIALLVDSFTQPSWVHKITDDIVGSYFAQIVLIIKRDALGNDSRGVLGRWSRNGDSALWTIYSRFDNLTQSPYPDPFLHLDIMPLIQGCPILRIQSVNDRQEQHLGDEEISAILSYDIDVMLEFSSTRLDEAALRIAKFGVWSASSSTNCTPRKGPPGFWEVMQNEAAIEFTLRMATSDRKHPKVLYRSWTSTDLCSIKGTRSKVYWKSAIAIVRKLRNLHHRGPVSLEEEQSEMVPQPQPRDALNVSVPTNAQMLLFLAKVGKRRLLRRLRNVSHLEQWFLAYKFGEQSGPDYSFRDVKYLKPPPDRFWADPFPLEKGGNYYIFLEEFLYKTMKGHISVIEMDYHGAWKQPKIILERDYHLSYPFLFEWRGDLYMVPETKHNNTIELYRCVHFPHEWKFEMVLIDQIQAVDATLHEMDGIWWLFCCVGGRDFASNDELHLFYAETPLGPWNPHRCNPIKSDVRSSRPAGKLFHWKGHLYRPSQDCSVRMGGALCINRVTSLSREHYQEEVITRIEPKWMKGIYGTHTLNNTGRLMVTDYFGYVRKYF